MKYYCRFFLIVSLVFLGSCKSKKISGEHSPYSFEFVSTNSIVELSDQAIASNKLIFLDVYADWCLPCKVMDEEVFVDRKLGDFYNAHFISYKADSENGVGGEIANLFNVRGLPTLLFLDQKGNLLLENEGSVGVRRMYELADEAIAIRNENIGE